MSHRSHWSHPARLGILPWIALGALSLRAAEADRAQEVLAKFPSQTIEDGQKLAAELLQLGPAAIQEVCKRVAPAGPVDDSKARFALGGLAFYVSRPGAEAERKLFAGALVEALGAESRPEVKDFLVSMLQLAGKDEAVAPLGKLLGDEKLCGPAARALVAIGTPDAASALAQALPAAKRACRVAILQAIATLRVKAAVPTLIPLAADGDGDTRREALHALAEIGDPSAAGALAKAAEAAAPYDRSYATARYLRFAQRLAEAGQKAECAKICRELVKTRTAPRENNVVASALRILVLAVGQDAASDVLAAADSPNLQLREAALALGESMPGEAVTAKWVERMKQAPPEQRAPILAMLGRRGDKSALPAVLGALRDEDKAVRLAAVRAVGRLGNADAVATELASTAAKDADPAVRLAALKTLGELANEQTLTLLIPLLLNARDPGEQSAAQRAVAAACARIPDPEKRADPLLGALPGAAGPKRAALLRALAAVGGQKALLAVVADTKSTDAVVQDAAVRALAEWPDETAAAHLLALARTGEKEPHRVLALRGYVRLAGLASKRPAERTLAMLKDALAAARRPEEKRLVLAGLPSVRTLESLKLAAGSLGEAPLQAEAAVAVIKIACPQDRSDKGLRGDEVAEALEKAIAITRDAHLRKQAASHLKTLGRTK